MMTFYGIGSFASALALFGYALDIPQTWLRYQRTKQRSNVVPFRKRDRAA